MAASDLVKISFKKVMQTRAYTVVILGTEEKLFAIYTDPNIGRTIQMHLTEADKPRPFTHDLINMIFNGFDIKVLKIIINDIQDTIYFARLFLEQKIGDKRHILEIDARPSDCITLALMNEVPVYCTQDVLDKTVPVEE